MHENVSLTKRKVNKSTLISASNFKLRLVIIGRLTETTLVLSHQPVTFRRKIKKMIFCGTKCQISSILAGLILIMIACFLQLYWESLLHKALEKKFVLSPKSRTYDSWVKTKVPVYCRFYFFNWTNPADLSLPSYKPVFEEVGPYVFIETLEKVDIQFHNNGTVSYKLKRFWYFDRKESVGPLTDRITSANPVGAAVKYSTRYSFGMSTITRIAAPGSFHFKSVKTVDELLFKGYEDKLINLGRFSQIFFTDLKEIPYDRFGWWYPRNGSVSEVYNMETGENGMDLFGELRSWNYEKKTSFYNGSCGDVYGSGGNFWPWNLKKTEKVHLFSADICRPISLAFGKELSYGGLPAYKYETGPDFVDSGMECLCNGECFPPGVFNASSCSKGAPVFISYPHFQYADEYYTNAVVGMKPDKEKHNIYLILDPKYGVPLELYAPSQINLLVETVTKTSDWGRETKKRIFFPVLWVDQSFKIRKEDLKTMIFISNLPQMGFFASIAFAVAGALLVVGSLACRVAQKSRKKVLFREIGAVKTSERKVTEPIDKHDIKFNYLKDSNL